MTRATHATSAPKERDQSFVGEGERRREHEKERIPPERRLVAAVGVVLRLVDGVPRHAAPEAGGKGERTR